MIRGLYYYGGELGYWAYQLIMNAYIKYRNRGSDFEATCRKYKSIYGKYPNLNDPKTLNEKILWLKLNDRKELYTKVADKYTVRQYLSERFGCDFLIPLFYETTDWRDMTMDIIPDEPCIIKASHSQGDMLIVRNKKDVNINHLRKDCRVWLSRNLYDETQEWQYKNCKPRIIIEKLLQDKEGHIPNDYKLHFINGKLQFVYCSVGRETVNKRNIYDADWKPLMFSWVEPYKDTKNIRGEEIPAPASFETMKKIGAEIAKDFPYVRVDFYDVDGRMYFGEITMHHGSGFDIFKPSEYDLKYGQMLKLPEIL